MKILTSREMIEIDRKSIRERGISGLVLMENAGRRVAEYIRRKYPGHKNVLVLSGSGNNGGDGLAAARYLKKTGFRPLVLCTGDPARRTESNEHNYRACRRAKIPLISLAGASDLACHEKKIKESRIILDAVLGLGLHSPLKGDLARIIGYFNSLKGKIRISVDIPTGLKADDPLPPGDAFKADATVTFGALKIAHVFSPARTFCGEVAVRDIGFPAELFREEHLKMDLIERDLVRDTLPVRLPYFHKNDFGHAVLFAGSAGKAGAAVLAARAALRSGAGLVTVICPRQIDPVIQTAFPEAMTLPVDLERPEQAFQECRELLARADAILAGCGIGTGKTAAEFFRLLLGLEKKAFILDADALNIISRDLSLLSNRTNSYILTPHPGEFSRLAGKGKDEIMKDPFGCARDFSSRHSVLLVLKSSETMIVSPDGLIHVNNTGNDGMATAGSGDVLAGILAGLCAQNVRRGNPPYVSAAAGVYLHALSGDIARKSTGAYSLLAGDILTCLPDAFKRVSS